MGLLILPAITSIFIFYKLFFLISLHIYVYLTFVTLILVFIFSKITKITTKHTYGFLVYFLFFFWIFIYNVLDFFYINFSFGVFLNFYLTTLLELINLIFFI